MGLGGSRGGESERIDDEIGVRGGGSGEESGDWSGDGIDGESDVREGDVSIRGDDSSGDGIDGESDVGEGVSDEKIGDRAKQKSWIEGEEGGWGARKDMGRRDLSVNAIRKQLGNRNKMEIRFGQEGFFELQRQNRGFA